MTTSKEIYMVYENMEKICKEVDAMFTAIDQIMNKNSFNQYSGDLRWDTSKSLGNPTAWLPYFSQRLYKKNDKKKVLGVNLLIKDPNCENRIPFITCGLIIGENELPSKSNELYYAGWDGESGKHIKIEDTPLMFSQYEDEKIKIVSYFLKLTKIKNLSDIEQLIVTPLRRMYETIPQFNDLQSIGEDARNIMAGIQNYTLTLEQIKGPTEVTD